jgi:hypothetical protein
MCTTEVVAEDILSSTSNYHSALQTPYVYLYQQCKGSLTCFIAVHVHILSQDMSHGMVQRT